MKNRNFNIISVLGTLICVVVISGLTHAQNSPTATPQPKPNGQTTNSTSTMSTPPDRRAISEEAAKEVRGKSFVEIEFAKDSAVLTENAKSSIQALVDQAKQTGKVDDVLVLSWADEEYPSTDKKKLSKKQIDLATQRNKAVEDYVKSLTNASVDRYNLAKQPNVFSKWFNTTDARLKNALVAAGLPTSPGANQYPTKASHSVIIVK